MAIETVSKARVSTPAAAAVETSFPALPGRQKQAQALITATIAALEGQFRRFDIVLLVDTTVKYPLKEGFGFATWARMLDRVIYYMREMAPELGSALCDAAERTVVLKAKQMKLVRMNYQPRPRD